MPKTIEPRCGTCRYWKEGDPAGAIGNKGICNFMARRGGSYRKGVPFWASDQIRATISFEGEGCPTYEVSPTAVPTERGKAL
jgi:hypothetical protein